MDERDAVLVHQLQHMVVTPTDAAAGDVATHTAAAGAAAQPAGGTGGVTADATWDFLTNAAHMFARSAELAEITPADIRRGYDLQGYRWSGCELQKQMYMRYRREVYPQYQCVPHDVRDVRRAARCVDPSASFFEFRYAVTGDDHRCKISHFQLRDLVWATSSYDVFYWHADGVQCWNPWLRTRKCVLGRRELPESFRLSALCADRGFVFAGDYQGRYCIKSLWADGVVATGSLALGADDDIVNHATPARLRGNAPHIMAAQNRGHVSCLDVQQQRVTDNVQFDWAVNCTALTESASLGCVVGDSTEGLLTDPRQQHRVVARLHGHSDYSFTCAFSPDERLVATGNQDTSARVYDVRWPRTTLATLCGYIGAMRIVKFSPCGRYLLASEPADCVHIYDVATFDRAQDIEFLGEVAGATFSPDANCMFLAISDAVHADGLVEYTSLSHGHNSSATDTWL
ncbi:hypothetical protein H4R19_002255 [Coemansia spiralis]|nr:hypothetical protein H4R19_002255 [Coemansia spiralis]